jgi:O-phosphoseryl-tRNA(Cys) synthetase
MTIKEHAAKHGAYGTARTLLNRHVQRIMGVSLSDLPDTSEMANLSEEIEEAIVSNNDEKEMKRQINEILSEVTPEYIEEISW